MNFWSALVDGVRSPRLTRLLCTHRCNFISHWPQFVKRDCVSVSTPPPPPPPTPNPRGLLPTPVQRVPTCCSGKCCNANTPSTLERIITAKQLLSLCPPPPPPSPHSFSHSAVAPGCRCAMPGINRRQGFHLPGKQARLSVSSFHPLWIFSRRRADSDAWCSRAFI